MSTILIELSGWCTLVQFDEVHTGDAVDLLQCIAMHLLRHPPPSSLPGSFLMRWTVRQIKAHYPALPVCTSSN